MLESDNCYFVIKGLKVIIYCLCFMKVLLSVYMFLLFWYLYVINDWFLDEEFCLVVCGLNVMCLVYLYM